VERPALYDLSVAAFGVFGAAFPLILFLVTIAAVVALAFVIHGFAALLFAKIVWLLAIPFFGVARSFFRKPAALEGHRLTRDDVPELFATLDRLRAAYRTPRLDGVLLIADYQAAVVMRPRLGIFGGTEHHLVLGLPTLCALEMRHLEAVLAHEFGHMAQKRRSFDRFIYALRSTNAVVWGARVPKWLHPILRAFFQWWYPRFEASSLVIARRVEREADRLSALTAGAKTAAEALVAFTVQNLRLERDFWPSLERRALVERAAPTDVPFQQMAVLQAPLVLARPLLEIALSATPDPGDTHPVLGERLEALGVDAAAATGFLEVGEIEQRGSAASELFGPSLSEVLQSIGQDWASGAQELWSDTWGTLHVRRKDLEKLDARAAEKPLDGAAARERALLAAEFYRADARALLEAQLALDPSDATVLLYLGKVLVAQYEDARGIDYLVRAVRADPQTARDASDAGVAYLLPRCGRTEVERFLAALTDSSQSAVRTPENPP
jgi:Zn-dependent protease with chaperone function